MARRIEVELIGDSRSLERAFAKSERSAREFNRGVTRGGAKTEATFTSLSRSAAKLSAVGFAGVGFADAIKQSIDAASDLNEQIGKTQVVFGKSAGEITDWSKTTTAAFGLSQRQALATASSFGALFAPLGVAGDEAARQSQQLTELGADLASFYNTDVQSALDAIRSGLVGEAEPLRQYGVLLSETRVQQQAMADTGKRNASALTVQEKALARIKIIFQDTTQAQGDSQRSMDRLAEQTKVFQANVDDLKVTVGQGLVPALDNAVTALNNMAPAYKRAAEGQQAFNDKVLKYVNELSGKAEGFAIRLPVQLAKIGKAVLGFRPEPPEPLPAGQSDADARADLLRGGKLPGDVIARTIKATKEVITPADVARAKRQLELRNQWFDAMLGRRLSRVQDIPTLRGQIAELGQIAVLIQQRMKVTKDITRWLNLEDQLLAVRREQRQDRATLAEEAKQKAADVKAAAEEARRAALETKLGWLQFAVERAEATKTIKDDRRSWRAIEKFYLERIRQEGRKLEYVKELWRARQKIKDLNKANADVDPLAGLMQVSSKRLANILAAGTGLGAAGMRRLSANIAGAEIQPLHVHVNIDGREVGSAVTKQQARTGQRTPRQTSGRRG